MDKVVILAYMGHKRQRVSAIKLLYQAVGTDLGTHVKTRHAEAWMKYKNDLQGSYSTRMALLVKACELDWASQWSISIQLLGTDLHRGAMLINNLLSVEERAFKSTDTTVRRWDSQYMRFAHFLNVSINDTQFSIARSFQASVRLVATFGG